jgi:hypothetical protein
MVFALTVISFFNIVAFGECKNMCAGLHKEPLLLIRILRESMRGISYCAIIFIGEIQ